MNNWKLLLLAIGLFFWSEIRSETFSDCFDLRYMMMDYLKDNSSAVSDLGNYSLDFARELATVNANWLRWTLFGMEVAFKNGNMEEFKRLSAVSSRFILFLEEMPNLRTRINRAFTSFRTLLVLFGMTFGGNLPKLSSLEKI